jgi:hypothetical protein
MTDINFDTKISVRQAYLVMFEYLDRYWTVRKKSGELAVLISGLQLWDSDKGKLPMDSSIFPEWLDCVKKVLKDEDTDTGYRSADIQLIK